MAVLLTAGETATLLRTSRKAVYAMAERGHLPEARLVQPERDADAQPVLRCARERLVPARVRFGERCPIVGDLPQEPARLGHECFERGHVVGVGAARCPPGGVGLEREPELGEFLRGRSLEAHERREGGGERRLRRSRCVGTSRASGANLEDPERFEGAKRLAHGRSADLEALGQLALVRQARSFGDLACEDRIADLEEDVVKRPEPAGGCKGHNGSVAVDCLVLP